MALSIVPMFAFQATRGAIVDPLPPIIFAVIAVVATILVARGAAEPAPYGTRRSGHRSRKGRC